MTEDVISELPEILKKNICTMEKASLDDSKNFKTTHTVVESLMTINKWPKEEIDMLLDIAINNHPVRFILNDLDVKTFYKNIIKQLSKPTEKSKKVEAYFKK